MLSDSDRERLRHEEIFREEIRASLQKPQTMGQKVYRFFNSSLGVFILSAVFLGTLSTIATKWLESHQREAQTRETIRRLDIEIGHRLQQLPVLLAETITYTQLHTAKGAVFGKPAVHPQVGRLGEFQPIFPEFEGRTLFFLIWELQRSLPKGQEAQLDPALQRAKTLPSFFDSMVLLKPAVAEESTWAMPQKARPQFKTVLSSMQLSRWPP